MVFFEGLVSFHTFSAVMAVVLRYGHFCCLPQFFGNLWRFFFQNVSLGRSPVCSVLMSPSRSQNSPGKHGLAAEFVNVCDIFYLFVPDERLLLVIIMYIACWL